MHILSVVSDMAIGGAQKLQVIFAKAACERGMQVTQVSFGPHNHQPVSKELLDLNIPVVYFPAGKLFDLKRLVCLVRFFQRAKPDLIHTHLQYPNIVASIAARLLNIPVVSTLHTSNIHNEYYHPVRFWAEKMCLRYLAGTVIAVGESVKTAYQPHLKGKQIILLPNPVSAPRSLPSKSKIDLIGKDHARLVVAVGRLAAPKGYSDLIQAFALVVREIPDIHLLIVGDGELKGEISRQIEALGMQSSITLLGARGDVQDILSISDLFVSASHWEGLPLAVLEAMAAGLPVIATNVGDIPMVVKEDMGRLVPPKEPEKLAQAVLQLCKDPLRMREMGQAGQKHVLSNYNTRQWMDQLMHIYQYTIEENRR